MLRCTAPRPDDVRQDAARGEDARRGAGAGGAARAAAWSARRWRGCSRARRRPGRAVGRAAGAGRHRRPPPGPPPRPRRRPRAVHDGRRELVKRRRRRRRGHRRHRAGPRLCILRGDGRRGVGGHRQQGAARRGRPDALRGGRRRRRRPLLRGRRRRRDPAAAPAARVARRRPGDAACSASSTAPPTTCSTRWTPPAWASPRRVEQAQALGYAEADPTADVEGFDAAAKAAILACLAFHTRVPAADVHREGITDGHRGRRRARQGHGLRRQAARDLRARRPADGGETVSVRVHPAMIPRSHPLAGVREAYNAVFVEAEAAGELMFYGRGAGGQPDRQRRPRRPRRAWPATGSAAGAGRASRRTPTCRCARWARSPTRYHVSLDVADRAGRARAGRAGVRRARRLDRDGPAAGAPARGRHADRAALVIVTHTAPDAALVGDRRGAGRARHRGVGRQRACAWRAGEEGTDGPPLARRHRGVPRPAARRRRTRPSSRSARAARRLTPARTLSARTGCDVWIKFEGVNPTGSFKDRGMTMAISKAAEAGAKAVICASTGNTSASAAAYATAAGMACAVLVPDGKIALGKLSQAIAHGATLLQVEGNFDDCLTLARKLAEGYPVELVNSVNPARIEGQKTAAFEVVDALGDAPDVHCLPVGNAGNITAYWKGYREYAATGRRRRRGCWASRPPGPRRSCSATPSTRPTPSPPPSGSATPRPGSRPSPPATSPAALIEAVDDDADPRRAPAALGVRGRLRRARVGGERRRAARGARRGPARAGPDRRLHRHRARAQGPAVGAARPRRRRRRAGAGAGRRRQRRARAGPRGVRSRPAGRRGGSCCAGAVASASRRGARSGEQRQPRAGIRQHGPGARRCTTSSPSRPALRTPEGRSRRSRSRARAPERCPRGSTHLVVRAVRTGLARAGVPQPGLRLRCVNAIPHGKGLGSSAAAVVAGLVAARGLLARPELLDDADVFALATAAEGHPDNAAASRVRRFRRSPGSRTRRPRAPAGRTPRRPARRPAGAARRLRARGRPADVGSARHAARPPCRTRTPPSPRRAPRCSWRP